MTPARRTHTHPQGAASAGRLVATVVLNFAIAVTEMPDRRP
jgi:hypothetical protein